MRSLLIPIACLVPAAVAATLAWEPPVLVAEGRALRGPWQQNESRYDYVDDAAVALDASGEALVVWVDQRAKDVFLQRFGAVGRRLGEPVNVSRNAATFSWLPRVAVGTAREVFVLWQEIIFSGGSHGGDILVARSQDGGATFSTPLNISSSRGGDGKGRIDRDAWHNGSLDLAVGPSGAVYAAWTEYEGALWWSRSADGGATFSKPVRLAGTAESPARAPTIAAGPGGAVHLAWTFGEHADADIRHALSADGGATFGETRIVARTEGYSDAPKMAIDESGTLHLVFGESEGGPFGRPSVHYTRSADGGRRFEPPRAISGSRPAAFPQLALDGKGRVIVAWEHHDRPRERARGIAMAVSSDGGKTFTAPAVVPGSADAPNGNLQGQLTRKLALDASGRVALAHSSFEENRRSRAWMFQGRLPEK